MNEKKKEKVPCKVIIAQNCMVFVFDSSGHQIPELQGPIFEVMEKIAELSGPNTTFKFQVMDHTYTLCSRWYFIKREREKEAGK